MGVGKEGNLLLVSNTYTNDKIWLDSDKTYRGYEAYEKGPAFIDDICKNLYSTEYGTARNMKIEDVNKLLGYTKNEGYYKSASDNPAWTSNTKTIGEIEIEEGAYVSLFEGYPNGNEYKNLKLNRYVYDIRDYENAKGYSLVACGSGEYWLSSNANYVNLADGKLNFGVMHVSYDHPGRAHRFLNQSTRYVEMFSFVDTSGVTSNGFAAGIRPVIELNTNVVLEENAQGVWEIVE